MPSQQYAQIDSWTTTGLTSYDSTNDIEEYLTHNSNFTEQQQRTLINKIMSDDIKGIEAIPYQFMESVDRRATDDKGKVTKIGRKFGEKIFGRLPLLFLTPCEPLFMDQYNSKAKELSLHALLEGAPEGFESAVRELNGNTSGRYYTAQFNYTEYYNYLNIMLAAVSAYLGIYEKQITFADGKKKKIGEMAWQDENSDSFKTFWSGKENIVFYLDGMESVSESFTNTTMESSLASQINGFSETAKEIRYLFGGAGAQVANLVTEGVGDITGALGEGISKLAGGGGAIVKSLSGNGVKSILSGGKIIFPKLWSDSDYSRSYSIDIKLRSPDHDSLSIFLNVIKPYCKLLALTLPRQGNWNGELDPNSYWSPFLVRAYSKGLFNIDMGIITSMNVTKGAQCCWNDDGLPTQIDIQLEIEDLYSHMAMSAVNLTDIVNTVKGIANNTTYMDFLANMAGLNIAQMDIGRRLTLAYYLVRTKVATAPSNISTIFDQGVTRLLGKMYNIF